MEPEKQAPPPTESPVEAMPPFEAIAKGLKRGQVIPFLGAGVNIRPSLSNVAGEKKEDLQLPTGSKLSTRLANYANFPAATEQEREDLARVASFVVETVGRRRLREYLHELFDQDYETCHIHKYLADLPRPLLIVTTNYDDLTEKAFKAKGRPYDLVVHPTDRKDVAASVLWWKDGAREPEAFPPNDLPMTERLRTTTVIYKMHGTVVRPWHKGQETAPAVEDARPYRNDSYVITEEDYVNFLYRMVQQSAVPMQFMTYFSNRQFLFLGYGLRDWNLRVVLKNLSAVLPSDAERKRLDDDDDDNENLPSWAIQYKPSLSERILWDKRGVNIYNQDINQFVEQLQKY
ncbi:MAG TPA: SIR2 family protein [Pyrinomonadaceae bacterium]|jgi:hypothetical protein|nr:SIR2 family protein [Pyrinomonadaceae bacterium]